MEIYELQNHTITYDDSNHRYCVDGKPAISVTQLLSEKYGKKYMGVPSKTLAEAAKKGTELHNAIECYEKYGLTRNDLIEFRDYVVLKEKYKFSVVDNEIPILLDFEGTYICGRLDLVLEQDGKLGLGDIKRTYSIDKNYLADQLNIYRLGYEQSYDKKIEFLKGIHLREGKRKVIKLPIEEEYIRKTIKELLDDK